MYSEIQKLGAEKLMLIQARQSAKIQRRAAITMGATTSDMDAAIADIDDQIIEIKAKISELAGGWA